MIASRVRIEAWKRLLVMCAIYAVQRANAQPPEEPRAVAGTTRREADAKSDGERVADPELVALTWQYRRQASRKRVRQPVWRPDGTRLTVEETDSLLDSVESFQMHWWQPEQLTPLVLVFRRGGKIKTGLSPAIVLADGRKLWCGTWGPLSAKGWTTSACAPLSRNLAKWPELIDIAVRVPVEEPQIVKTAHPIPDQPIEVASGVRWYIDRERGMDRRGANRQVRLPAAVFEVENESPDSLVSYEARAWLRDKEAPLRGSYVTIFEPRPGVRATLRVSEPLDDLNVVEKAEFTRQEFKIQQFNRIKLRLDLLLPLSDDHDRASTPPKLEKVIPEQR